MAFRPTPRRHRSALQPRLFAFAALLLLGALAQGATAAEAAGRVVLAIGEVEAVSADGTVRDLERGDTVFSGDTFRTGARGRAQLRLTDGGRMALRPGTEIALEEYEYEPSAPPARQRTSLQLTRGGVRAITGAVADRNRSGYRVRTPFAVVGVRGTDFSAAIADLGDGERLYVGVREGGIFARNDGGEIDLGLGASFSFAVVEDFRTPPEGMRSPPTLLLGLFGLDMSDDGSGPDGGEPGEGGTAAQSGPAAQGGPRSPGARPAPGGQVASGGSGPGAGSAQGAGVGSGGEDEDLVFSLVRRCL